MVALTPQDCADLDSLDELNVFERVAHAPSRRVLFFDHTARMGGGEIALFNLVRTLDRSRYTPVVAVCDGGPLVDKLVGAGIETHVLPLHGGLTETRKDGLGAGSLMRLADIGRLAAYVVRLARFIRSQRIELVHTNSLKADLIGGAAARCARVPVLWHVRDRIADDYLPRAVVRAFRVLCRVIPNYLVANSNATLQTLGLPEHKPGAPAAAPDSHPRAEVVHDGIHVPADEGTDYFSHRLPELLHPTVTLVGRIARWKGQHVFLRAAARVHAHFPSARFQIVGSALFGEDDYDREIRELAASLDLGQAVEFLGFRDDVPDLLARCDVLVHASITGEPFGQVVIEGMSSGRPVVATNGGGIPEIVVDGVTGLLVPPGDDDAMAAAICRLLADSKAAKQMGELGRERVRDFFTIERTAAHIEQLYDRMLATHVRRR